MAAAIRCQRRFEMLLERRDLRRNDGGQRGVGGLHGGRPPRGTSRRLGENMNRGELSIDSVHGVKHRRLDDCFGAEARGSGRSAGADQCPLDIHRSSRLPRQRARKTESAMVDLANDEDDRCSAELSVPVSAPSPPVLPDEVAVLRGERSETLAPVPWLPEHSNEKSTSRRVRALEVGQRQGQGPGRPAPTSTRHVDSSRPAGMPK